MRLAGLAAVAAAAAAPALAASDSDLVAATPCLYEYRYWAVAARPGDTFRQPTEFTAEQCARAREVHAQMEARRIAEIDQERASEAAEQRREDARQAEARRLALTPMPKPQAAADGATVAVPPGEPQPAKKPAAKPKPQLPGVRLGMTRDQVLTGTSWGKPYTVRRITDGSGRWEFWLYGDPNQLTFKDDKLVEIRN